MNTKPTVIVTGGAKGIGSAISKAFYDSEYAVVIGSRTDNGFSRQLGDHARFLATDVTKPEDLMQLVEYAVDWTGRLDVMINNAGFSEWRSLDRVDEPFWYRMQDTILKGTFFGCQAATKHIGPGGSIINISSLAGKRGSANNSVYCASKFGVNGITQSLAKELGAKGIRVNAICPVYVETDGLMKALGLQDAPPGEQRVDAYLEQFRSANSALGSLPTGNDVGQACLFLSSKSASAITGQCINIDCGVLPQ